MKNLIKKFSILAMVASSFAGHAGVVSEQADVYERLGTAGEYPIGYKTDRALTIKLRKGPTKLLERDENCKLDAKADFGFTKIQKTVQVGKYRMLKAMTIEDNGKTIKIAVGDIVEDLSYLAEGFCDVRANGMQFQYDCFGNNSDDGSKEQVQDLIQEGWHYVSCKNTNGWVESEELGDVKGINAYRMIF